ncbi:MAG: FAD-dependent oxidoreductase [Alphaproteobacteria bacterium]
MKSHARVAVIGGGINGCSTLYHLTRLGWTDVVLIEKGELTSGSTWHAAGMVPGFAECALIARILKESQDTYHNLEALTGSPSGVHRCGSLRLARSRDEMDENRRFLGIARQLGVEADIVGPQQAQSLFPLMKTDGVVGALHLPNDCFTDPSQTTQGLARKARESGAEIYRHTKVTAITRTASGEWRIETDKGVITAGAIVNCAGMWAKEISAMVGGVLPAVSIEHEFLVTGDIPEVAALPNELPMLWDMTIPLYTRADRKGLIISCYEDHPKFFGVDGVPEGFGQELLPPDLERTESRLLQIYEIIPALKPVGIRTVVNGPTPRSPDMRPLVGPAHGYDNFYVMCGVSGGFLFSSTTRYLAEWIVQGRPSLNIAAFDVNRFGAYADKHYAVERLSSGHAFASAAYYPHVEAHEGRPGWTSPLHDRLAAKGAVFGVLNGWEVANWFAPKGEKADDVPSYERTNWFPHVAAEARAMREGVGIMDWSSAGKFEIAGPDAASALERAAAGPLPLKGAFKPVAFLNGTGHLAAVMRVARLEEDRFYVVGLPVNAQRDELVLRQIAAKANAAATSLSNRWGILVLVGPKAESVIASAFGAAYKAAQHGNETVAEVRLRNIPLRLTRFAMEDIPVCAFHHAVEWQIALYEALVAAGATHGLRDTGFRAYDSLRVEAGIGFMGQDYWRESAPEAAGLPSAKGKGGAANGKTRRLVRLAIEKGPRPVDPWGDEAVISRGRDVGTVTSGAFGHGRGTSMALAMVEADALSGPLEVEILGERYAARVV